MPARRRPDPELVALLARLDVPACDCKLPLVKVCGCHGKRHDRLACSCPFSFGDPCEHVRGIDPNSFPLSIPEWIRLLLRADSREYGERRRPRRPARDVVSREARVAVMARRFRRGEALRHPKDCWRRRAEDDRPDDVAVVAGRKRNGRLAEGELRTTRAVS